MGNPIYLLFQPSKQNKRTLNEFLMKGSSKKSVRKIPPHYTNAIPIRQLQVMNFIFENSALPSLTFLLEIQMHNYFDNHLGKPFNLTFK